jgi:hypothetical protein
MKRPASPATANSPRKMNRYFFIALLLCFPARSACQLISNASCEKDGKAHITYKNGTSVVVSPLQTQVGCNDVLVAKDGRSVGWAVLVENCCTSYPVPTSVVVMKSGRSMVFSFGQMVWRWRFLYDGKQVAVLWGPVHGWASTAILYDIESGKELSSWNRYSGGIPQWAETWEQEFEPSNQPPD